MTRSNTKSWPGAGLIISIIVVITIFGVIMAACGSDDTQLNDAPVGKIDDSPAFVHTNADKFPNVSAFCMGPNGKGTNGVYTTSRDGAGSMKIVVNDPGCPGYNPDAPTVVSG